MKDYNLKLRNLRVSHALQVAVYYNAKRKKKHENTGVFNCWNFQLLPEQHRAQLRQLRSNVGATVNHTVPTLDQGMQTIVLLGVA